MKKHFIFLSILTVITLGAVLFSLYQRSDKAFMLPARLQPPEAVISENQKQLVPARPEDYGMVVTANDAPVLTQGYWDGMLSEKIKNLKTQAPAGALDRIKQKVDRSQVKSREKMILIDENIKKFSEILAKNPDDPLAKERLEHFLILKSIANGLPDNE